MKVVVTKLTHERTVDHRILQRLWEFTEREHLVPESGSEVFRVEFRVLSVNNLGPGFGVVDATPEEYAQLQVGRIYEFTFGVWNK